MPRNDDIIGGRYRVVRLLGRGGMGAVYEAIEIATECRIALKILNAQDLTDTEGTSRVMRFEREARVVATLTSEHIARVLDAGLDPETGTRFIAMEYLEGSDLHRLLRQNLPLRPEVALRIVAQACVGLDAAHCAGFVHRDIKPANLFLVQRPDGQVTVKLLDFGIAKVRAEDDVNPHRGLTHTGSLLGTPLYVSPEQAQGRRQIDHRTDIWSLGMTAYHALTAQLPYRTAESIFELISRVCSAPPPPIQEIAPWVPAEIAEVVHGALQLDPDDRYPTASAMLEAMAPYLGGDLLLTEEMLVPLNPSTLPAAPRSDRSGPSTGRAGVSTGRIGPPRRSTVPIEPPPSELHETPGAALLEQRTQPKRAPMSPLLFGMAATAVGLGGLAAVSVLRPERAGRPPEAVEARVAEAPPPAPAPVAPTAVAAPSRWVNLVVEPSDVTVEIEGVRVDSQKGIVKIEGVLGSIHRVRISKGKSAALGDVAITESGALPPKLALEVRPPAASLRPAASAPPASSTAASSKLRTSFE